MRRATADDMPAILDMGERFHAFSGDQVPYCRASAEATVAALLGFGFVLLAEADGVPVGMIGVAVTPLLFNAAHLFAQELMWWVDEGQRGGVAVAMIREAEAEARRRGAVRMQMIALAQSPAHVERLYGLLGYRAGEASFVKEL